MKSDIEATLRAENAELRARLEKLEERLRSIGGGGADAAVSGENIFIRKQTEETEINERKQIEGALALSEERLSIAKRAAGLGVHDFDPRTGRIQWDAKVRELWGVGPDEPINYEVFKAGLHSGDLEQTERAVRAALDPAGDGRYLAQYRIINRADQRERWIEATGQVFFENGQAVRLVGTVSDITSRKEAETALQKSETAFRTISNAAPAFVWVCSPSGENVFLNDRWHEYTGQTVEDAAGYGWATMMHPDDQERILAYWEQCRMKGEPAEGEVRLRRRDGEYRWNFFRLLPQHDAAGRIEAWYGCSVDVHEAKLLEFERERILKREQQARQLAEEANRAKDDWLAMVTHELRSPLNAILGYARIYNRRRRQLAPEFAEFVDMVSRNGERQNELINDLLDTARMATGKLRLETGPVELVGVIFDAIDTVRPAALAKGVLLQSFLEADLGTIMGDAARLQQVAWNLLTNAVKFTPTGGNVTVSLHGAPREVVLTVSDSGQGIAPEFLPNVFDRFSQADNTLTRRHGGLGLGLALVKQIVELHGGTIAAASAGIGRGATFSVRLPMQSTQKPVYKDLLEMRQRDEPSHIMDGALHSSPANIFAGVEAVLVEDDADAREMVKALLAGEGVIIQTAATADAAWPILTAGTRPSIVICDIGLPEEDGYSLLGRLRQWEREHGKPMLPAIALTAQSSPKDQWEALNVGFHMHIAKPFEPEELLQRLASVLKKAAQMPPAP